MPTYSTVRTDATLLVDGQRQVKSLRPQLPHCSVALAQDAGDGRIDFPISRGGGFFADERNAGIRLRRQEANRYGLISTVIRLGDQLVRNPDLASDPSIAGKLLAAFLAAHEVAIKQALLEDDLKTARKLVNGGSNGLDRFMDAYTIGNHLLV